MKHIHLLCWLCILLPFCARAQTYYHSWGTPGTYEAGEAITKYENDLIVGGIKNDSAFVMRVNSLGEVLWLKKFTAAGSTGKNYVSNLFTSSDGFILGTGISILGSAHYGYYFKLDGNGNFIFLKSNNERTYFKSIYEKNSTQYLLFGARYSPGITDTDIKILTIDRNTGNIISQTDMIDIKAPGSFSFTDDMEGTAKAGNNSYFSTGRIYLSPGSSDMRPHLNKYDADGNVIWSKFLHKSSSGISRTYPQGMIYKKGYLYIPYSSDETCTSGCSNYFPGLIKADTLGNVIFDYTYDIPSSNGELCRGIVTDGEYFYIVGYTNFNTASKDLFVLKTDMNGTLISSAKFGIPGLNENFLVSFIQPAYCDSSFIYITGSKNTGTTDSDIFLVKIDTSLEMNCYASNVVVNKDTIPPFSQNITVSYIVHDITVSNTGSEAAMYPADTTACQTNDLTQTVLLSGVTVLNATHTGATGYDWSTGAVSPSINTTVPGTFTCIVSVGCCSFIHKFIVVEEISDTCATQVQVLVPNIFTPNGDGINDYFAVDIYPSDNFYIRMFDRWGVQVFESGDPGFKWPGSFKNNDLADGMYSYLISYGDPCNNNEQKEITGWVHLNR